MTVVEVRNGCLLFVCVHDLAVYMHAQSEYQGHIQMLMNYVDPSTDGIVIAGGDGTVLEVLNGLLQRRDAVSSLTFDLATACPCGVQEAVRRAVVGILPLGKENQSFKTLFPSACWTSTAR